MKHIRQLFVMAILMAGFLVPGMTGSVAAQDANLCEAANLANEGDKIQGYTVVYGSGGSGNQVVLGYGGAYLSGGSGNDVLCAWGGNNVLDGGSGNDVLIVMSGTGNELYGGSGNDTLIGIEGDVFDGGSGKNTLIANPAPTIFVTLELNTDYPTYCILHAALAHFEVGTDQMLIVQTRIDGDIDGVISEAGQTPGIIDGNGEAQFTLPYVKLADSPLEVRASFNGVASEWIPLEC